MKKEKVQKGWHRLEMVATFIIKPKNNSQEKMLIGPKIGGALNGFMAPVGGKIEKSDKNPLASQRRECRQECGLRPIGAEQVALLTVITPHKRRVAIVHIFKATKWHGRLKVDKESFPWLRFFAFNKIPWARFAPREKEWIKKVFFFHQKLRINIWCGKDRKDVRRITTAPLY
jgi:ADP-ribose pyrophosphatase YjhB (NUDIX family)